MTKLSLDHKVLDLNPIIGRIQPMTILYFFIAPDKRGYPQNSFFLFLRKNMFFFISPQKHMLWVLIRSTSKKHLLEVLLMSTHNICFLGEIKKCH